VIDLTKNPEALLTANEGDVFAVGQRQFYVGEMKLGESLNISLTSTDSRVDEYNDLVYKYHDGDADSYPDYVKYITHVRMANDGRLGDALFTREEAVEMFKTNYFRIL
jgi:hypothetical protein